MDSRMHCVAVLVVFTVSVVESGSFNCTNCGTVKCGENEVFVGGNARQDEFCKPLYTPLSVLKRPRQCVCKHHFVRNSWGECVAKKNCLRCKSRLQKDWHLCSSSCPVTGNKAIRFFCRTMCTPGCDCPPGWVVDPSNWKNCITAEASPPLCQPHSKFQPCVSTCEPVCGITPPKHCFTQCHRGACVCNKGFAALVRNGVIICVHQENCEWYLRTAHLALNRTAFAGRENVSNNLGGVTSGPGGVVLPGAIGHANSTEGTYFVGTAPTGNGAVSPLGAATGSGAPSRGIGTGIGGISTGIGAAGLLSSTAVGLGGIGAGLGSTLPSVSTRHGVIDTGTSGTPAVVSVGHTTGSGVPAVSNAFPSVSTESTISHASLSATGVRTGLDIGAGVVGASRGAEGRYFVGAAPTGNGAIGPPGATTGSGATSPGIGTGIGGISTGIGAAGLLSSAATGLGGIGAGLGITLPSVSTRHGLTDTRTSGTPAVVSVGHTTASDMPAVSNAFPTVSTGSTINHGSFSATGVRTGLDIGAGVVGASRGAEATPSSLPSASLGVGALRARITGAAIPSSARPGVAGMGAASPRTNAHVPDGAIAVSGGAAVTPAVLPIVAGELSGTGGAIASTPGSVFTGPRLANTGAAGALPGVNLGNRLHGIMSTTRGAVGSLSGAGVRHGTIPGISNAAVPVSVGHGGIYGGAGSVPTVISAALSGGGTLLNGTSTFSTFSAGGIHAAGATIPSHANVVTGPGTANTRSGGASVTTLLSSPAAEVGRITSGIAGTNRSLSSESYRRASFSTLPDGIYTNEHGTAIIPAPPAGAPGVAVGSSTSILPPHLRAATSEVGTGLSAGGRFYVGSVRETAGIAVGNGTLPVAGGLNTHALETISTGGNGVNVRTASGAPVSTYSSGSRGHNGAVGTPETLSASIYPGSSAVITTESSGAGVDRGGAILSVTRRNHAAGGARMHSGDASVVAGTEAGANGGFGGVNGRHIPASAGHRWTYVNALGDGLDITGGHTTPSAGSNTRVSTSTVAVGNGIGSFVGPTGAASSNNAISIVGNRGTTNTRTAHTSETAGISGAGVGIGAVNDGLASINTDMGTLMGTSRGVTVSPSTSADRRQNSAIYTTGVLPAGSVHIAPIAIGAHTRAAGANVVAGDVAGHRINVTNIDRAKFYETHYSFYPFVLSILNRPNRAESTSSLLTSHSAFSSALSQPSGPSPNIDKGENKPNTASVVEGANTPLSGMTPSFNK